MKIGLFFGSFNPIHTGHCIIANFVLATTKLDQVWFVVSPQNPLKPSAGLLNEYHRLHLTQLAIEGEINLRVTDIEFRLPKPSFTVDTLSYLQEKYSHHSFSIILGSDSFENLPKWKNYFHIIQHYPLYIYLRPGHEDVTFYPNADITILKSPLLEISATHIRNNIKEGRSIRYLVPDKVMDEITRNGYYRN
ncbi:MAG: nicotinate-nucleotide adenylyltransferase [Chitinophagaceae bacterium]|nr:nicotinate-nucleotide adenylyltransferase [Chitinophagaceae bacterium]